LKDIILPPLKTEIVNFSNKMKTQNIKTVYLNKYK